ncbi:MAG: YdcF family protein [Gemmatimonadaceae bacterium]
MLRPTRPFYRRRRVILGATAVLMVLWLASMAAVLVWALEDDARKADAIIVMGAAQYQGKPSPVLRVRLDHALALWQRGLASRLVLTGGIGEGDTISEAEVSRVYVMARGVPDSAILLENDGRTSAQSLRAAVDLLHEQELRTAIVVSDPFHMLRLEILGRRYGIDPYTSPALPGPGAPHLLRRWGNLMAESVKAPLAMFVDW